MENKSHKAGFVSILGRPNVGKSTFLNSILKQKISITSSKMQTTRHRILGILNGEDYQIVFSDTPGLIVPQYELHKLMLQSAYSTIADSDIIIIITDIFENDHQQLIESLFNNQSSKSEKPKIPTVPILVLINKIDLKKAYDLEEIVLTWNKLLPSAEILPISALKSENLEFVKNKLIDLIPEHPPFYDKSLVSDRPEKFFAAEIIREKIFLYYNKEIPYSSKVVITEFLDKKKLLVIKSNILVERDSQKSILIGKRGQSLKKLSIEIRKELEKFFQKKIYIETRIKTIGPWRRTSKNLEDIDY